MQRKINLLLVLFSLIGGFIGFIAGEIVLQMYTGELPGIVLTGLYFGILALCIGLSCLVAEMIKPQLNGQSWRQRYVAASWKLLIPATLVMLFVLGLALDFVYKVNLGSVKSVKDIVLVIDNSGSMEKTDPRDDRYKAAKQLVGEMDSDKRVAIITFNSQAELLQPFVQLSDQATKDSVMGKIDSIKKTTDGTDIGLAMTEAMDHIRDHDESGRGKMVILLSDGFSQLDRNKVLSPYIEQGIAANTIGLSLVDAQGSNLLRDIAEQTGGRYYDVANTEDLSFIFQKIYDSIDDRSLITERKGPLSDSTYYAVLRVVALVLIGAAIGVALGLVFDNRFLARSFAIGGVVAGLIAGLLLEAGLSGQWFTDGVTRLLADLILAGVIAMFTIIVPIKESGQLYDARNRAGRAGRAGDGFAERPTDNTSRGF
ncbi:vWA domain-containing protein [Paenibacillus sp. 481]|uniref:vWA domain-containing protein n=1 Tax=Paenibacillus sp. 481 TaxID=2835869 RepID=UPI001E42FD91|nr:VWA domain-containing protein [Paenibacillus sp. 481]UHA75106.1 VWA domain-containing protein [Paenibacillus sp. 481]